MHGSWAGAHRKGILLMGKLTRSVAVIAALAAGAFGVQAAFGANSNVSSTSFSLFPNASFVNCMRKNASTT
ncbi:MAG TPA: hypothetical protein VGI86_01070, partial [Acidimicrobiia bacterium]